MVRHKTRPLRSIAPEENSCMANVTAAVAAAAAAAACSSTTVNDRNGTDNVSGGPATGATIASTSPLLSSFWKLRTPGEATGTTEQPPGKLAKANRDDHALVSMHGAHGRGSRAARGPKREPFSLDESDDDDDDDDEDGLAEDYCHPLSRVHGMPTFSDLQVTIAKAIAKRSSIKRGGYASFEDILDFVTKHWHTLRRKDGSHYSSASTYIRRAVQANLRSTANGIPLFKIDPNREGYWAVCQTVDDAKSPSLSYKASNQEDQWLVKEEPSSPQQAPSAPPLPLAELTKEEIQFYEAAKARMSALQRTVSECIVQSGGSCHFEFILDTVHKRWLDIKNEDNLPRVANLKKLVGACVARDRGEDSKALFMRDHNAESSGYWKLGISNPYAKTSGICLELDETGTIPSVPLPNSVEYTSSSASRRNAPLTHLQELIVDAISANGEAADLDTICAYIKERWRGLLRRDGTPYAADIRKAVQSSLSNASSPSPIFVKLPETEQTMWGLTARGKTFLREKQSKRIESPDDDEDSEESNSPFLDSDKAFSNGNGHSNGHLAANGHPKQDQIRKKRRKKSQFSGIQQMIAEIMERNGGSAPFDMILTECQKRWRTLRKRDGTPYNADPKRSINASLTKTPDYGQVFERDPSREGHWRLTPDSQIMWDQLKTGSVATATAASPVAPQPVVIPHMLMMPQVNLVMNQMGAAEETRSSEETALKKHEDELQRKRERERERRERKRQEREAAKASLAMEIEGSNDTALPLESRAILAHFSRAAMIEDEDDDLRYEAQARRKKRFRRDESEREEVVEEEEELEYGEGSNVAPKLGTMQAMIIRTIHSHGGKSSFKTIFDSLCEKVENDKGLMSAVNWARVHRSNFPTETEEEDKRSVKIFASDEQGNWRVSDPKLREWVVTHKRERPKIDKPIVKKKRTDE